VVVLCALTAACMPQLQKPELSVVDVRPDGGDFFSQKFKVRLRVQNPNSRELPVKGLTAVMELAGDEFARGQSMDRFTVPAGGEAEFDMMLTTNVAATVTRFKDALRDGRTGGLLDYRIVGEVSLASGWLRTIPFEQRGTLSR
jgi:LEA14-like dessication related protein